MTKKPLTHLSADELGELIFSAIEQNPDHQGPPVEVYQEILDKILRKRTTFSSSLNN